MSKAPAFQLYAADFYTDTVSWTATEVGAYFRLLMHEWINGPLPTSIVKLARIAGVDPRNMQKMWSLELAKKFITDDAGLYINVRLEQTRSEQRKRLEIQRNKGKSGAEKRWHQDIAPAIAQAQPNDSSSSSSSSSSSLKKKRRVVRDPSSIDDWIASLRRNIAYAHIDFETEFAKMDAWLLLPKNKGRKKTQRFILNWLNKIEKPITGFSVVGGTTQKPKPITYEEAMEQARRELEEGR